MIDTDGWIERWQALIIPLCIATAAREQARAPHAHARYAVAAGVSRAQSEQPAGTRCLPRGDNISPGLRVRTRFDGRSSAFAD